MILIFLFWIFLGLIAYTYFGYTLIMIVLAAIHRLFAINRKETDVHYEPPVTLFIPAYNEENNIANGLCLG